MSFYNDVQSIAKTKELTEKIDKAVTSVEQANKEAIPVKRSTVMSTGSGLPYTQSGSNSGGGTQGGFDVDGHPINVPLAPPPVQTTGDPSSTNSGDKSPDDHSGPNSQDAKKDNDKTGSADSHSGSSGAGQGDTRTENKDQADGTNAEWAAIEAAMLANGIPLDIIEAARVRFFEKQEGTNEVSDVYEGRSGYTPDPGYWTSLAPHTGDDYTAVSAAVDQLRALVGKDPDDHSKAVRVNLDGKTVKPSKEETEDADQNIWSDANTPPLLVGWDNWRAGFWYQTTTFFGMNTGETEDGAAARLCAMAATQAVTGRNAGLYTIDNTRNLTVQAGYDELGTTVNYLCDYYLTWSPPNEINTGWSNGHQITVVRKSCTGQPNIPMCPASAPTQEYFPTVGLWQTTLGPTAFTPSPYDSEVPLAYKQSGIGKVRLYSAISGDTYAIETAANGGIMLTNETTPNYLLFFGSDRTLKYIAPMAYYPFFKSK